MLESIFVTNMDSVSPIDAGWAVEPTSFDSVADTFGNWTDFKFAANWTQNRLAMNAMVTRPRSSRGEHYPPATGYGHV